MKKKLIPFLVLILALCTALAVSVPMDAAAPAATLVPVPASPSASPSGKSNQKSTPAPTDTPEITYAPVVEGPVIGEPGEAPPPLETPVPPPTPTPTPPPPTPTPELGVMVRGELVRWRDAKPYIDGNQRMMVPMRTVAEWLGLSVTWEGEKRNAIFSDGTRALTLTIGSDTAKGVYITEEGFQTREIYMDTAPVIKSGRTYAPVRYLGEFFGYRVTWNDSTRKAELN